MVNMDMDDDIDIAVSSPQSSPVLVGAAGGVVIRQGLATSTNPVSFIADFQRNNALHSSPAVQRLMPLLELLGMSRNEVHRSALDAVCNHLLSVIPILSQDRLSVLLKQSFPYIEFEALSAVPLAALSAHHNIPSSYLIQLAKMPSLFSSLSSSTRRQVLNHGGDEARALLRDIATRLVDTVINDQSSFLAAAMDMVGDVAASLPGPAVRGSHPALLELASMIGGSLPLYNNVLSTVRNLFIQCGDTRYAAMRSLLLLAMHSTGAVEITSVDPCSKAVWCLAEVVSTRIMGPDRLAILRSCIKEADHKPLLGDMAMVLADPLSLHTLLASAMRALRASVEDAILPKDSYELRHLTYLITLSLSARTMVREQVFDVSSTDKEFLQVFYPILADLVLDAVTRDIVDDDDDTAINTNNGCPLNENEHFVEYVTTNAAARSCSLFFAVECTSIGDKVSVERLLPALLLPPTADVAEKTRYEFAAFLWSLPAALSKGSMDWSAGGMVERVIIHGFLVPLANREDMDMHVMVVQTLHRMQPSLALSSLVSALSDMWNSIMNRCDVQKEGNIRAAYDEIIAYGRVNKENAPFLFIE